MSNYISTTGIFTSVLLAALITPLFALACSHSSGAAEPSAFTDLKTAFSRFNR